MHSHSKWFRAIRKTRISHIPDIESGGIIEKVAAGSPAEALFLKPGHVLLTVNGNAAASIDIDELVNRGKSIAYSFYCPKDGMIMDVEAIGPPLGIRIISSSDSIVEKYKKLGNYSADGFVSLWEREDYEGLKSAIEAATHDPIVVKLFKKITGRNDDGPVADLIKCIYDIEAGAGAKSFAILEHLASAHNQEYPANLKALIHYYQGLRAHMANDWTLFEEHIAHAYKYQSESARINKITEVADISQEGSTNMFGRNMPMHYDYKFLEGGKGGVKLRQILDDMEPSQVLPICFMPSCRLNEAYDDALKVYQQMYPHVKDCVAPLVVITDTPRRKKDDAKFYRHEKLILKSETPLTVLQELAGHFAADLELAAAPTIWAVNKSGVVIWDCGLEDAYKYWELRAAAIVPPPQASYRFG